MTGNILKLEHICITSIYIYALHGICPQCSNAPIIFVIIFISVWLENSICISSLIITILSLFRLLWSTGINFETETVPDSIARVFNFLGYF